MTTSFTLYNIASQIPVADVARLTTANLTVTEGITTSDGAFTTTTIVGYAPTDMVGSASGAILPFMKNPRSNSKLGSGYISIPAGATITRCTLSNNGVEILPVPTSHRIYTSFALGILPVPGTSLSLYNSTATANINGSSVLVVERLAWNSIGSAGNQPVTLGDHSFVLLQSSAPLTAGEMRISIQYQMPIVSG